MTNPIEHVAETVFGYNPKYPFPDFGIVDLMRKLGEMDVDIHMRYDSKRDQCNFTLIGPQGRICDTDEPLQALCQWVMIMDYEERCTASNSDRSTAEFIYTIETGETDGDVIPVDKNGDTVKTNQNLNPIKLD